MAAFQPAIGYKCEFVSSVPDYLHCKACNFVARRLTLTSCCGESYCHACIADTQEQGKLCPACGEKDFCIFGHRKNQKQINSLLVYCRLKGRGCGWSGTLEQLNSHLDPDQDNCQYVDTECPLNCQQTTPKNKVEQHVAQECSKRPHVCQHCGFKATYDEVVDTHLPECKYVALQCPNCCGVSCERGDMEDHMKICRLEEIVCEFSGVGCDGRFRREDQEEHTKLNSQRHLTLIASLAGETKEKLQDLEKETTEQKSEEQKLKQKLEEQEKKLLYQDTEHKEEEQKLKQILEKQSRMLEELEKRILHKDEERKAQDQMFKLRLEELEKKLLNTQREHEEEEQKLKQKLKDQEELLKQYLECQLNSKLMSDQNEAKLLDLSNRIILKHDFLLKNFSGWKIVDPVGGCFGPAMYTHVGGYKFCISAYANGTLGANMQVYMCSMPGEYDSILKWPAKANVTIVLINQCGGENVACTSGNEWPKPYQCQEVMAFLSVPTNKTVCPIATSYAFLEQSRFHDFLANDALHFKVSHVDMNII